MIMDGGCEFAPFLRSQPVPIVHYGSHNRKPRNASVA